MKEKDVLHARFSNADHSRPSVKKVSAASNMSSSTIRRTPSSQGRRTTTPTVEKKTSSSPIVAFFSIVGHAGFQDRFLLFLGCAFAVVNGLCWPLHIYLISKFADTLSVFLSAQYEVRELVHVRSLKLNEAGLNSSDFECVTWANDDNATLLHNICNISLRIEEIQDDMPPESEFETAVWLFAIPASVVTLVQIITGYLFILLLNTSAERSVFRIRQVFMKSLIKQDVAWFDIRSQGELVTHVLRSMDLIQTSLGEKLGVFLMCVSEVTVSVCFSFWSGWKLTLVMGCLYPILVVTAKINMRFQGKMNKWIRAINGEMAGLLQEVFVAVRTVVTFGGEHKEIKRLTDRLRAAREMNSKQNVVSGMNFSFIFLITQGFISLGFWLGIKMLHGKEYTVQDVLIINMMTLLAGIFIRMGVPLLELLTMGFTAAADIVSIIQRVPIIDSNSTVGVTLQELKGDIEFTNVHFWYPSNPGEKKILRGLNLKINAGETAAFVGPSGSGKSTIMQLVQRFYDPQKGKVKVDGTNLQDYNLGWFRRHIGIVSQEPCLFDASVRDNIRFGNDGATEADIIQAAKAASAHDFIMKMPKQYDTKVGSQGSQMSGGERQRIAIARALVRNPRILLLDEATSALDNESQNKVQESLEKARNGRTVLVIAHRLATIRSADRIVVVKNGKMVEQGTHDELVERDGVYKQLLNSQQYGPHDTFVGDEDYDSEAATEDEEETEDGDDGGDDDDDDDTLEDFLNTLEPTERNQETFQAAEMRRSFWKVMLLCKYDWNLVLGCVFSFILFAISHPARAYVFGNIVNVVVLTALHGTRWAVFYPCAYIMVGFLAFVIISLRTVIQSKVEENLLYRVRQKAFASLMTQEIGWFDEPAQNVGNLTSLFTLDAENVKRIPGLMIGTWCYTVVAIASLFSVSLWINWELALVTSAMSVFVFVGHYFQGKIARGTMFGLSKSKEEANNIAIETIRNIRTVISLHLQAIIYRNYSNALGEPRRMSDKQVQLRSVITGLSEGLVLGGLTVCMTYAAFLMFQGKAEFKDYQIVVGMLIINLMEVSHALAASPEYSKSCVSAYKLLQVIERKPKIDRSLRFGMQLPNNFRPRIEFRDVKFSYPTRANDTILNNLNLTIENGEMVAFVGRSGCGKSTAMQLLQRLYDLRPDHGSVSLDGYDIRCLNVPCLRSLIGIVSQEPTMFNRTIADNIKYGVNEACMHEVIDAARQANIHEFIVSLRQGYETRLGQRGVLLSGGQKQRVAIARALVKNPKILLLDEATSALDTESEGIVQEALDKASEGRTCIVIAHRLTTIMNADKIAYFEGGQVVEYGTQDELLEKRGKYFDMWQQQMGPRRASRPLVLPNYTS